MAIKMLQATTAVAAQAPEVVVETEVAKVSVREVVTEVDLVVAAETETAITSWAIAKHSINPNPIIRVTNKGLLPCKFR